MNLQNLTTFQKEQLLHFFFHDMSMEQRYKLMATLPRAYNAACNDKVVEVHHVFHASTVAIPLDQCERLNQQYYQ